MSFRRPVIAGNWKMHGPIEYVKKLVQGLALGVQHQPQSIDIIVLPSFVHLMYVHALLKQGPISMGAQDLYLGVQGAFTGEVSGPMLVEAGCHYVLVGHSERRIILHEGLDLVASKFKAAVDAHLVPILCVGETGPERDLGKTEQVVRRQLETVIELAGINAFRRAIIAYEPVWAIGTGVTAQPHQAQEVHALIRTIVAKNNVDIANAIRILYGGSMKADNAAALLAMPDIDGGLIGGASLIADSFLAICGAARPENDAVRAEAR